MENDKVVEEQLRSIRKTKDDIDGMKEDLKQAKRNHYKASDAWFLADNMEEFVDAFEQLLALYKNQVHLEEILMGFIKSDVDF